MINKLYMFFKFFKERGFVDTCKLIKMKFFNNKNIKDFESIRKEKILSKLNINGLGLEIGPSHNPVLPKREGYNIHILDHLNQEDLKKKYQSHGVNIDNIEPVDYIWNGEAFNDLISKDIKYDYIIASHVIEHVPDLIGFLLECDKILKDDGILSLVIPDKRYCFDYFRSLTSISQIIDSHLNKNKIHTPGSVVDHFLNISKRGGLIAWDNKFNSCSFNLMHTLEDVNKYFKISKDSNQYLDIHNWVFVPHSFRLILNDLALLNLIPFKEICFFPTVGFEFFISLSKIKNDSFLDRIDLLKKMQKEIIK